MRPPHITSDNDLALTKTTSKAVVVVSIDSGPGCSGSILLARGRHVIGRSPAAHIRIADGRLGLHHAVLDVGEESVTVTQLSGQAPIRLDGDPVDGTRVVQLPARLSIGMNELRVALPEYLSDRPNPTGIVVAAPHESARFVVQRGRDQLRSPFSSLPSSPRDALLTLPAPVEVLRTPPTAALVGVVLGVLVVAIAAGLFGQSSVALPGMFGVVAALVAWTVGSVPTWQCNRRSLRSGEADRRRFLDELASARHATRDRHTRKHSSLREIIEIADALVGPIPLRSDVWQHRLGRVDQRVSGGIGGSDVGQAPAVFRPVIGRGNIRWTPELDGEVCRDSVAHVDCAATIDDVGIPFDLVCGEVVAITGGLERDALARSIVCQMAVHHGPADWQLVVVSGDRTKWEWAQWLPHVRTLAGTVLIVDPDDAEELDVALILAGSPGVRPVLLMVDDPALLAVSASPLCRFVERVHPATLVTIEAGTPLPAVCVAVIEIGSTGAVMTTRLDGSTDETGEVASSISMSGLSMECAAGIALPLAKLIDPETPPLRNG